MKIWHEVNFKDVKDIQDGRMAKRVDKAIALGVHEGLQMLEEHHKKKYFLTGSGSNPKTHPTKITSRTGNLARSYMQYWKKGQHFGYYGTTLKRARLLETGKPIIKPVRGKALAIPTPAARVGVGAGLWPKDYPKGELFRPNKPGGGKYSWLASTASGKFKIMFMLVKQAKIKARPTVKKTARETGQAFELMMAKKIEKAMAKK